MEVRTYSNGPCRALISPGAGDGIAALQGTETAPQLSLDEALAKLPAMDAPMPAVDPDTGTLYCQECYLPLRPDPPPEKLFIFLHALRYTTSLGCFETEMPAWAAEDWEG